MPLRSMNAGSPSKIKNSPKKNKTQVISSQPLTNFFVIPKFTRQVEESCMEVTDEEPVNPVSSSTSSGKRRAESVSPLNSPEHSSSNSEDSPGPVVPPKKKIKSEGNGPKHQDNAKEEKLAEFKNGKLVFIEKKFEIGMQASVMEELLKFNEYLQSEKENNTKQLEEIPQEHLRLVGMLVQERDMNLKQLAKQVIHRLCAIEGGDSDDGQEVKISLEAVMGAIKTLATRKSYGVSDESIQAIDGVSLTVAPPHLIFYRWEVNDIDAIFAKDLKDKVEKRRIRREQASAYAQDLFNLMSTEEKTTLIMAGNKKKLKSVSQSESTSVLALNRRPSTEQKVGDAILDCRLLKNAATTTDKTKKRGHKAVETIVEKDEKELEKAVKEAEKRVKNEAKESVKKKKDEEHKKKEQNQTSLMGFFTPVKKEETAQADEGFFNNPKLAFFYEMFPPFHIKQNMKVVVSNKFVRPIAQEFDRLVCKGDFISDDDIPIVKNESRVLLEDFLSTVHPRNLKKRGINRHIDLRRLLGIPTIQLSIQGSHNYPNDPKSLQAPKMKLLKFCDNYRRPAYYGTWTKYSQKISGRRPFTRDLAVLDYDYDSEIEWEEEGEGEDLKSEDNEDESERDSQADEDEEDGWEVPEGYLSEGEGIDDEGASSQEYKPKQRLRPSGPLQPLVPTIVGPYVEDLFNYAIKVLTEKSLPIDPFREDDQCNTAPLIGDDAITKETEKSKPSFPDEYLPILIDIILQNRTFTQTQLMEAVKLKLPNTKKTHIGAKIKQIATKEKRGTDTKPLWYLLESTPPVPGDSTSQSPIKNKVSNGLLESIWSNRKDTSP